MHRNLSFNMNQMVTNQATLHIVKEETIEVEEHFFNIDVKQEIDEDLHSVNVINNLNGETNAISSIKQEFNVELNADLILEECNASIKQESNIDNIENKLNYSNGKKKITKLGESQSCVKKKLKIYSDRDSDSGVRKILDNDVGADFSDDNGTSQNDVKRRRKIQNKIRCKRYRDKKKCDAIFGSPVSKNQIVTLEEEDRINRRKEYNKQKSKRYRDRKRAIMLYKVVKNVSSCQTFHNPKISGPAARNEPYILKSHSDFDNDIHNDIASQAKNNKKADALVGSLIYKNRTITVEETEKIKRRKEYNKQKSQRYRDRKRAANLINLQTDESSKTVVSKCQDFHNLSNAVPWTRNVSYVPLIHTTDLSTPNEPYIPESHSDYDEDIHNDTLSQVQNVPQFKDIIGSEIYKNQTIIDEDEEIKRRKEYNKQKSQRYRDRKRAAHLINLQIDQFSETDIHIDSLSQVKNVPQYRDKNHKTTDVIAKLQIYKNQTITVEEGEEIKHRKEYNKQKCQRYRNRKRAANFINLQMDQPLKTVVNHVSKCQDFHNSQAADPLTRSLPYMPTFNTPDLLTQNKSYISDSYSDYDDDIHNDTLSQVKYVRQYRDTNKIITHAITSSQIYIDEDEEIKCRKEYNKQKSQRYRDRKKAANFINLQTDQSSKTDIHIDTLSQVKNVPQHRDKNNITVKSQIYEDRTIPIEDEEEIKRRKEYNKQKSQRYRDRKRAANLINLLTDQSSKIDVNHVSKCQDFHNLQNAVPSTRNAPYVPSVHTADLSPLNEPYIPESHSDYDGTSSQVSQLLEPIITIYVPNTQNLHDVQSEGSC